MGSAERARRAGASDSSDPLGSPEVNSEEDSGEKAASEDEEAGSGVFNDPEDADGLVPLIDPPGVQGQSELPGTRVNPRTLSQMILATLAVAYTLYFAKAILLPVVLALMLALLFRPVVRLLRRRRVPEVISAIIIVGGLIGFVSLAIYEFAMPATSFVRSLPEQLSEADEKIRTLVMPFREINRALKTGERLTGGGFTDEVPEVKEEEAAAEKEVSDPSQSSAGPEAGPVEAPKPADLAKRQAEKVRLEKDRIEKLGPGGEEVAIAVQDDGAPEEIVVRTNSQPTLTDWVLSSASTFLAGTVICLVLLYFLLATGDGLINNVLHVLPNFREKRGVVELIYAAEGGVSKYLLTVTMINAVLGIVEAIALLLLGVENAPLWGAMAFVLNFIPYVGAIAGMGVVGLVSFLQFESFYFALLPPIVYWGLTAIEGNFVTPTILGKQISLNPVMIFLSLSFWGWIWGIGGALLAVPLLAMTKIVCDQFKPLQPIGKLLEQ